MAGFLNSQVLGLYLLGVVSSSKKPLSLCNLRSIDLAS